jgi:hypothetical protein
MAVRPDLPIEQLISIAIENRLLDVHTAIPGKVISYDENTKRAEVKPMVKRGLRATDDSLVHEALPNIPNVPVVWPSGGGFELHLPLAPGDTGWLFFAEVATSAYEESGEVSNAGDVERFGLSSACFFPFARSPINTSGPNMATPEPFVFGSTNSAELVALANLVLARLNAIVSTFNSHTHLYSPGPSPQVPTLGPNASMATPASVACEKLKSE